MNFSVGYQFCADHRFTDAVLRNRQSIAEVYFAFGDFANGRNSTLLQDDLSKWAVFEKQQADLAVIHEMGLPLNLLLNGNCYGAEAQSRALFCKIGDTVEYLGGKYRLTCITTTSPLIAKFIKQNFPEIEVRASVNMEIGDPQGMDYIAELFDSFYLKREYNRSSEKLKAARGWCDQNGKKLYGLANSGCLNFCSVHNFHDNLVAHEAEIAGRDNAYQFEGQCREYLREKHDRWLEITNFIRPEDVHLYEGLFDGMKLATRVSRHFARIIDSYVRGSYYGNLPELLEPNHADLFYPRVIENQKLDPYFTERTLHCNKNCNACGYCRKVQQQAEGEL